MNTDLTNAQKDYAVFLPAISGFFATFIGKQRYEEYVEKTRIPSNFPTEVESLNWLEPKASMFNYHWSLYSAGHAELDVNKNSEPNFKLPYKEVIKKAWGSDFTLNPDNYENNEYVMQSIGIPVSIKVSD